MASCDVKGIPIPEFIATPTDHIPTVDALTKKALYSVAVNSKSKTIVAVGGIGEILRSTDNGDSWRQIKNDSGEPLTHVVAEPPNRFLAVGAFGTIVISDDDGATWSRSKINASSSLEYVFRSPKGSFIAVGYNGLIVRSVNGGKNWSMIASGTSATLYYGTATSSGALLISGHAGTILRSTDDGETWSVVNQSTIENYSTGGAILRMLSMPDVIIAVGQQGLILRSIDEGRKWSEVRSPKKSRINDIAVSPKGTIIATGDGGAILRSFDRGLSWSLRDSPSSYTFSRITVSPSGNMVIVGALGSTVHSSDDGMHWFSGAERSERGYEIFRFEDGFERSFVSDAQFLSNNSFISVSRSGRILRTQDNGKSWRRVYSDGPEGRLTHVIAHSNGNLFAVGSRGEIGRSQDRGETWNLIKSPTTRDLSFLLEDSSTGSLLVFGDKIILRSSDAGSTWQIVGEAVSLSKILFVYSSKSGVILISGERGEILRSIDGGINWQIVVQPSEKRINSIAGSGQTLIAAGAAGKILLSLDGGPNWSVVDSGTEEELTHIVASLKGGYLGFSRQGAIIRSLDDGRSWSVVDPKFSIPGLSHVSRLENGTILAFGAKGATIRTTDSGATWSKSQGLDTKSTIYSITSDATGMIMAVGSDGGIFSSYDDGGSWAQLQPETGRVALFHTASIAKGMMVAVGGGGLVVRTGAPFRRAPHLSFLTSYYENGIPSIRFRIDSFLDTKCTDSNCLVISGISGADRKNGYPPRVLPASAIAHIGGGEFKAIVEPSLFSVSKPDPVYVQIRTISRGYSRIYPSPDTFYTVDNHHIAVYKEGWFQALSAVFAITSLAFFVLKFRPLWLIKIGYGQLPPDASVKSGIPGLSVVLNALFRFFFSWLIAHKNVLDAWAKENTKQLSDYFESVIKTNGESDIAYFSLPVKLSGRILLPDVRNFRDAFHDEARKGRVSIQIVAPGGSGKTKLATEVGRWIFGGALLPHPAVVVFVDEEFGDLLALVRAKLRAALQKDPPSDEILRALLAKGRICVIVDRFSERSTETRRFVENVYGTNLVRVIICTSRSELAGDWVESLRIEPLPLDPTTVGIFLNAQLQALGAERLYSFHNYNLLSQQLEKQITIGEEELLVTPLLVRLFAVQVVASTLQRGGFDVQDLPANVPDIYFTYVERLTVPLIHAQVANSPNGVLRNTIRRAASVVAYVELGSDFRPKLVEIGSIVAALESDEYLRRFGIAGDLIQLMERAGLLRRKMFGAEVRIEYALDPIAECLSAYMHAVRCGANLESWRELLTRIFASENSSGFLLALRMNHAAYMQLHQFPEVDFGLVSENLGA